MNKQELIQKLKANDSEYIKFDRIENPPYPRPDLCAFIKLHELCGGKGDAVTAAEHDEIYLGFDLEALASNATDADIIYLQRCGVRVDEWGEGLAMFV